MPVIPLAVQLYTLRTLTKTDFAGTVAEVARIGYQGVELAGYGNLGSAAEVKQALDEHGLRVAGTHAALDKLESGLHQVLDEAETLATRNIVCPMLPKDRRGTAEDWRQAGEALNRIGRACRERGFTFAYHNHSFEFERFDGKTGLDLLWENSDPELVRAELDVYWAQHGGHDPVESIRRLGNRLHLLHLKDMAAGEERRFAEVGRGILDFPAILKAAEAAGVEWNIVEQDQTYESDPLESVRISFENLRRLGAAAP